MPNHVAARIAFGDGVADVASRSRIGSQRQLTHRREFVRGCLSLADERYRRLVESCATDVPQDSVKRTFLGNRVDSAKV